MKKYKFVKIKSNHNKIRDESIICDTCSPIELDKVVFLTAPARDFGDFRYISTSPVKEIKKYDNYTLIKTASGSIYKIEEIEVKQ